MLGGRVRLLQPRDGYRAAVDPVLLAAAMGAGPGEAVLDLGCGVGAAGFCLTARRPGVRVVGLEIQPDLAALARRNAALNGMEDWFRVAEGDAARAAGGLGRLRPRHDQPAVSPGGGRNPAG